jgi:hypothetical protein
MVKLRTVAIWGLKTDYKALGLKDVHAWDVRALEV